jgi:hypothetical protein
VKEAFALLIRVNNGREGRLTLYLTRQSNAAHLVQPKQPWDEKSRKRHQNEICLQGKNPFRLVTVALRFRIRRQREVV